MSNALTREQPIVGAYAPPASRRELLAAGLAAMLEGRPLPESLRPPAVEPPRAPATTADGIARILAGPARH